MLVTYGHSDMMPLSIELPFICAIEAGKSREGEETLFQTSWGGKKQVDVFFNVLNRRVHGRRNVVVTDCAISTWGKSTKNGLQKSLAPFPGVGLYTVGLSPQREPSRGYATCRSRRIAILQVSIGTGQL